MKGQTTAEFTMLFSFMLIVFVAISLLMNARVTDVTHERTATLVRDVANLVLQEASFARSSHSYYGRNFSLPEFINGERYTVRIVDGQDLLVTLRNTTAIFFLPDNVTGTVGPGENTITKYDNGTIVFDSKSSAICGDAITSRWEGCDEGAQPGGQNGVYGHCNAACTYVLECGNGIYENSTTFPASLEQCDGTDLGGDGCYEQGYPVGLLQCTGSCTTDASACGYCNTGNVTNHYNTTYNPDGNCTITYQPDESFGKDTYIFSYSAATQDTNYGNDAGLGTQNWMSIYAHDFLEFNTSIIPRNAKVVSANLTLYKYQGFSSDPFFSVQAINQSWDEMIITWNNGASIPVSGEYTRTNPCGAAYVGWVNMSIPNLTQAWINGSIPNYGLQVRSYNTGEGLKYFRSSNYNTNPTQRPKLNITYTPVMCGNGVQQGNEACDNGTLNGQYGYCNADCTAQIVCGDGIKNGPELCDGSDFGTKTCADFDGYEGGDLQCSPTCDSIDHSWCCNTGDIENFYTTVSNHDGTCTVIFQPNETYAQDTYFDQTYGTTNYGNAVSLRANTYYGNDLATLLQFPVDIISPLTNVTNASLYLYQYDHYVSTSAALTFNIYRILVHWNETAVTYSVRNSSQNWGASGMQPGIDYDNVTVYASATANAANSDGIWWNFTNASLKTLVKSWVNRSIPNYGMTVHNRTSSSAVSYPWWNSSNTLNAIVRPKLNVTYQVQVCGNGDLEGYEDCDNGTSNGIYGRCNTDCTGHVECGDGIKNGPEQCDGADYGALTCRDFGFTGGHVKTCNPDCSFNTVQCRNDPCMTGSVEGWYNTTYDAEQLVCILTQQPNETYSQDTWFFSNDCCRNYNLDGEAQLAADADSNRDEYGRAALLLFPTSMLPSSIKLINTMLYLYQQAHAGSEANALNVYRIMRRWNESTATGAIAETGQSWAADGMLVGTDFNAKVYNTTPSLLMSAMDFQWWNFSMSMLYERWFNGTYPNYGLTIQNTGGIRNSYPFWTSSNGTTPALRPKLVITYSPYTCGDNYIEGWEECDPLQGFSDTCTSRFNSPAVSGTLECGADCRFNATSCSGIGITWQPPTPEDGSLGTDTEVALNVTIQSATNNSVFLDWDGSLRGYWSMEYNSGTLVYDNSSYGNNGTFSGAGFGPSSKTLGKYGSALTFDGTDDRLNIPDANSLDITDNITITAWINLGNPLKDFSIIITKRLDTTTNYAFNTYTGTGKDELEFAIYNNGWRSYRTTNANLLPDKWYHVAVTFTSGDESSVRVYLNGTSQGGSWAGSGTAVMLPNNQPLSIGGPTSPTGVYFKGKIDELTLHNRILSPEEINASMRGTSAQQTFTPDSERTYTYRAYANNVQGNVTISTRTLALADALILNWIAPTPENSIVYFCPVVLNVSVQSLSNVSAWVDWDFSEKLYLSMDYSNPTGMLDNSSSIPPLTPLLAQYGGGMSSTNIVSGMFGKGLVFDNINDYLLIPTNLNPKLNIVDELTLSAWIKINDPNENDYNRIISKKTAWNQECGYELEYNPYYNRLTLLAGGGDYAQANGTYVDLDTNWHHVAGTIKGSRGRLYVDGVDVTTDSTIGPLCLDTGNLVIGMQRSGGNYFNGMIDEVHVFNRSLSSDEIKALYSGKPYFSTNISVTLPGTYPVRAWAVNRAGNFSNVERLFYVTPEIAITWLPPTPGDSLTGSSVTLNTSVSTGMRTSAFFDWHGTLAGYWSMDNNITTGMIDNSTYANFAPFSGGMSSTNITSGMFGRALKFDGVDDCLPLSESPIAVSTNTASGTLSAWIKTREANNDLHGIIVKQNAYGLFLYNNVLATYDYSADQRRNSTVLLNDSQWHHVAMTFRSGVSGGTKLYVDGSEVLSTTITVVDQLHGVVIGAGDNPCTAQYFNGSIDEAQLHSRVLSPEEIRALYHAGQYRLFGSFTELGNGRYYTFKAYAVSTSSLANVTPESSVFLTP